MGAIVEPVCGHASHLFDRDVIRTRPHLHTHHLTDPDEFELTGFIKIEFCCHGCSTSLLVYYNEPQEHEEYSDEHSFLRDSFFRTHAGCPNHGFEDYCPNDRLRTSTVDMRGVPHKPVQEVSAAIPAIQTLPKRLPGRMRHH